ncbi:hypothetical protein CMK12_13235 [Candidatus Poribacteria bacterium]|nr:hypothetical protein [Candidatus Poribacteria bacterium]
MILNTCFRKLVSYVIPYYGILYGFSYITVATVDPNGNRITDRVPQLVVTGQGKLGEPELDNQNKVWLASYIADRKPGTAVVSVLIDNTIKANTSIVLSRPDPNKVLNIADAFVSQVKLEAKPTKLPASLKATAKVTIALYNPEQNLVKGEIVNLTVDKGTIETPAKDNGDGTYTAIYTAGNVVGEAKITAATKNGKFATTIITLLETKVELSLEKNSLPASSLSTTNITITVRDSNGKLVKGETVSLKAEKGTLQTAVENSNGTYTAKYVAGNVAGEDKITVTTSAGKEASVNITLVELALSPEESTMEVVGKASVATGEVASVLVTLQRNDGLPVTGREVILQVEPADNLKLYPTAVTDQEGKASFKFTSSQPGVRMITASVGEVKLDATVAVIFSGGAVETISITAGIDPNRIKWEKDSAEMVLIPAGSFEMGDHHDNREMALPVHTVTLNAFYMDTTEVTAGQFKQFLDESGWWSNYSSWEKLINRNSPQNDHPAIHISWNDAKALRSGQASDSQQRLSGNTLHEEG